MLAGIALLGVVTASFASWLIEKVQEVEEESQAATRHDVALLADEVAALRDENRFVTTYLIPMLRPGPVVIGNGPETTSELPSGQGLRIAA